MKRYELKPTLFDRAIGHFMPMRGFRRLQARMAFNIMREYGAKGRRGFDALSTNRFRSEWVGTGTESADRAVHGDLKRLRAVVRKLMIDNAHAAGARSRIVANTVGTGISLQSRVVADKPEDLPPKFRENRDAVITPEKAEAFNRQAERIWRRWAGSREVDAGNRLDFYGMQKLVLRTWIGDGEIFCRFAHKDDNTRFLPLCLEMVDPDRVDTSIPQTTDAKIRQGIKIGEGGAAIAYHILQEHPADMMVVAGNKGDWIPAYLSNGLPQVLHIYEMHRPGQTRGYSPLAPALDKLMDLHRYWEAEIMAARIGAAFCGVIKSEAGGAMLQNLGDTNAEGKREFEMEPGIFTALRPGETIETIDPKRPNTVMAAFTELILRAIGVALDLPFELIALDFSKTTYSSARAALLQAYIAFRMLQEFLIFHLFQPSWRNVISEAAARGMIDIPGFALRRDDYLAGMRAIVPGWEWVDPAKEAIAVEKALRNHVTTLQEEAGKRGLDYEELIVQAGKENELLKTFGLLAPAKTGGNGNGRLVDLDGERCLIQMSTRHG